MLNYNGMRKIFNQFIASLLTISLSLATVICCCIAPVVVAHFHKVAVCSHCTGQGSQSNHANPASACQNQLTSADLSSAQVISSSVVSTVHFPTSAFLIDHQIAFTHVILLAYPPGAPPLGASLTPLYLRTFNLRI